MGNYLFVLQSLSNRALRSYFLFTMVNSLFVSQSPSDGALRLYFLLTMGNSLFVPHFPFDGALRSFFLFTMGNSHRNSTIMSQQDDTSRGRQVNKEGCGGRGYGGGEYRGRTPFILKAFKHPIIDITSDIFNTGQRKFASQFTQSRKTLPVMSNKLRQTETAIGIGNFPS